MRRAWLFGLALSILGGCSEAPTLPQVNPLPEGRLSSGYGTRSVDPVSGKATPKGHHDGYDLAAAMGTPIRASKAGKVSFAGRKGGYGNSVILDHPGGWSTLYGHASRLVVSLGQEVDAGQILGHVGSTGRSTGPHLHYELRHHGKSMDPGIFAASKPRPLEAMNSDPTPPPVRSVTKDMAPDDLSQEAPPLRYPADPDVRLAMQALDGSVHAMASAEPPTRWQRLKTWAVGAFQRFAALLTLRRVT